MSLYTKPSARVFTSGMLSKEFGLTNGTQQGCPLSPLIFSLAIEPLVESNRSYYTVHGITIDQREHKLGLFTDDIIITLTNPLESVPVIQSILTRFATISLYKVNTSKCFALPVQMVQPNLSCLKLTFTCCWDSPSITYLGIQLTSPMSNLYKSNFPNPQPP